MIINKNEKYHQSSHKLKVDIFLLALELFPHFYSKNHQFFVIQVIIAGSEV